VKIQHLKKFIVMKYGLNENFVVSLRTWTTFTAAK
jgi:hypothetical protein